MQSNGNVVWTAEKGWRDGPPVTVTLDERSRLVTKPACQARMRTSHSDDLIEVYSGRPSPVYLCGFHAQSALISLAFASIPRKDHA